MSIALPTQKVAAETQDPKNLIIYGSPKVGKTTLLAELPNSLLIDLEEGSTYIDAVKVKAHNIAELSEICKAIMEADKPYKFIVLDTITALEEMCKPLAAKLYNATPMGKNYTGGGEGILALPNGSGYLYLRNAIEKVIDMVSKCSENIILVGHVKDKAIVDSEGKEQGSLKDFDMTGNINYRNTKDIDQLELLGLNSIQISNKLELEKYLVDLYLIDKHIDIINNTTYNLNDVLEILKDKYDNLSFKDISRKRKNMSCTPRQLFDMLNIKFTFKWFHVNEKLNDILCNKIIEKFYNNEPLYKIAIDCGLNESLISKILHNKLTDSEFAGFNIHFFDEINTEEKAYWLGFLYADGYVNKNKRAVNIDLQSIDIQHLTKFQNSVQARIIPRLQITAKYNRCRLGLNNKYFCTKLISYGCMPNKSLVLKFPIFLSNELVRHFIRGYFDGDGCLSYNYTNPHKNSKITISCSIIGTFDFLNSLQNYLRLNNIHGNFSKNNGSDIIYNLYFSKSNSVKLVNLLYKNSSIYLDRKYNRYQYFYNNNFAVQKSDFLNNDRAISEKAKQWIKENTNSLFKLVANSEITF